MTVTTASNKAIVAGNGATTVFSFNFIGVNADLISVTLTDSGGVETLLDPSLYTLALNPAGTALWGIGGTLTYPLTGPALGAGNTLTLLRELPLTQAISLQNQTSYGQYNTAAEQAVDLLEMQLQQVYEQFGRALTVPASDEDAPVSFPPAALRALKVALFDADGQPTVGDLPASGIISAAMQAVVAAASLAAGRTAFGLRELAELDLGAGLEDDGADAARVNFDTTADATNQTVDEDFHLTQRFATGTLTYALPRANTLWNGFGFWIYSSGGSALLVPNAADAVQGLSAGTTFVVPAGTQVFVSTDAAASGVWKVQFMPLSQPEPQGYLTLSITGLSPILAADAISSSFVYYRPFKGALCPISDGVSVRAFPFATQNLELNSNHVALNLYDVFAFLDTAGTFRIGTGPSWLAGGGSITAGACARGTGAGSTDLVVFQGLPVNTNAITLRNGATTNVVAAQCAVFLGSIFIDAVAGQVTCHVSYGQSRKWGVSNAYNQQPIELQAGDPTVSWTYQVPTYRPSNNNTANSLTTFCCLADQRIQGELEQLASMNNANGAATLRQTLVGIGLNSTTAPAGVLGALGNGATVNVNTSATLGARRTVQPQLGINVLTSLEQSTNAASVTSTFFGGNNGINLRARWMG